MCFIIDRYVRDDIEKLKTKEDEQQTVTSNIVNSKTAAERRRIWSNCNVADEKTENIEHQQMEKTKLIKQNLFLLAEIDKLKAVNNQLQRKSVNIKSIKK